MSHDEFVDVSFDELEVTTRNGEIIDKIELEPNVYTFRLKLDKEMKYYPGQYVLMDFDVEGKRKVRAYTMISSSLDSEIIDLNIQKSEDTLTSHIITSKEVGDIMTFRGPYGRFVFIEDVNVRSICLVAVNIGINPFIAFLRFIRERKIDSSITLIYQWDWGQRVFEETLKELEEEIDLNVIMVENVNNYDNNDIENSVYLDADIIYVCGEKKITNPLMDHLDYIGVERGKIRLEQWF